MVSIHQSRRYHPVSTRIPVRYARIPRISHWYWHVFDIPESMVPLPCVLHIRRDTRVLHFGFLGSLTGTGLSAVDQSRRYHRMSSWNPARYLRCSSSLSLVLACFRHAKVDGTTPCVLHIRRDSHVLHSGFSGISHWCLFVFDMPKWKVAPREYSESNEVLTLCFRSLTDTDMFPIC